MKSLRLLFSLLLFLGCAPSSSNQGADSRADTVLLSDLSTPDLGPVDSSGPDLQLEETQLADSQPDTDEPADLVADTVEPDTAPDTAGSLLPTLYPLDRVHSPLTPAVKANLLTIFNKGQQNGMRPHVFAKLGASFEDSTASFVGCLDADKVAEYGYPELKETVEFFAQLIGLSSNDSSSWKRNSVAAISGWAAKDGLLGYPGNSKIEEELDRLKPAFALIAYNGNDIGKSSITQYHANMLKVIEICLDRGIIPILRTKTREETTSTTRPQKIVHYNAVIRGLAQQYQIPLLDLNLAIKNELKALSTADHLHLRGYSGGNCTFTAEGLEYGKPIYNLIFLQTMDRVRKLVNLDQPAPDAPQPMPGKGTHSDPHVIEMANFLQFRNLPQSPVQDVPVYTVVHHADTSKSTESKFDKYPACDDQDESGNEVVYRVVIPQAQGGGTLSGKLTLRVFEDDSLVDVDPHWLTGPSVADCVLRDDETFVQNGTDSGTYYFVLDTFSNSQGITEPGLALFSIIFEPGF